MMLPFHGMEWNGEERKNDRKNIATDENCVISALIFGPALDSRF